MGNCFFLHASGVGNRTSIEEKIANPRGCGPGGGMVTARIEPCISGKKQIYIFYFINLTRNSSMLRPLELDEQSLVLSVFFCNMSDRSMLVLYPALRSSTVSSVSALFTI